MRCARLDDALQILERSFSDCTSYTFELQAYDVLGDMAYAAGLVVHRRAGVNPPISVTISRQPCPSERWIRRAKSSVYRLARSTW